MYKDIELHYVKSINDDPSQRFESVNDVAHLIEFGLPAQYIQRITLPQVMYKGEEYTPNKESPILIIQRSTSVIKEFFSPPFFSIMKRIRIQFHWDGIEIVGSSMDSPNCFTLPIPNRRKVNNWYFKIICKIEASIGLKPLYISVDTYHENVLLKWFLYIIKGLSLIALVAIPILILAFGNYPIVQGYFFSDFINKEQSLPKNISPWLLGLLLLLAFWKNIDSTFKTFYEKNKPPEGENLGYVGIKSFSNMYGIDVKDKKKNNSNSIPDNTNFN